MVNRRTSAIALVLSGTVLIGTSPKSPAAPPIEIHVVATQAAAVAQPDPGCRGGPEDRGSELCAQWTAAYAGRDSAEVSFWTMLIALGGLLASLAGLFFIKRTLDATLRAVQETANATSEMEKQSEFARIAQRPWVVFDVAVVKAEVSGHTICIGTKTTARNIGHSVAENMQLIAYVYQGGKDVLDRTVEQAHQKLIRGELKNPLVPGDMKYHWNEANCTFGGLRRDPDTNRILFHVLVLASYTIPGDAQVRYTQRAYRIDQASIEDVFAPEGLEFPPFSLLSHEELVLRPAGYVVAT